MAETAAGGWVRSAFRSSASTRPCACARGMGSAASGSASLSTSACASATESSAATALLHSLARDLVRNPVPAFRDHARPIMAGLAAALLDQVDVLDAHAALDRLHHVVDGEAGDRRRHQRLHLDAGLAGDLHGGTDGEPGRLVVGG